MSIDSLNAFRAYATLNVVDYIKRKKIILRIADSTALLKPLDDLYKFIMRHGREKPCPWVFQSQEKNISHKTSGKFISDQEDQSLLHSSSSLKNCNEFEQVSELNIFQSELKELIDSNLSDVVEDYLPLSKNLRSPIVWIPDSASQWPRSISDSNWKILAFESLLIEKLLNQKVESLRISNAGRTGSYDTFADVIRLSCGIPKNEYTELLQLTGDLVYHLERNSTEVHLLNSRIEMVKLIVLKKNTDPKKVPTSDELKVLKRLPFLSAIERQFIEHQCIFVYAGLVEILQRKGMDGKKLCECFDLLSQTSKTLALLGLESRFDAQKFIHSTKLFSKLSKITDFINSHTENTGKLAVPSNLAKNIYDVLIQCCYEVIEPENDLSQTKFMELRLLDEIKEILSLLLPLANRWKIPELLQNMLIVRMVLFTLQQNGWQFSKLSFEIISSALEFFLNSDCNSLASFTNAFEDMEKILFQVLQNCFIDVEFSVMYSMKLFLKIVSVVCKMHASPMEKHKLEIISSLFIRACRCKFKSLRSTFSYIVPLKQGMQVEKVDVKCWLNFSDLFLDKMKNEIEPRTNLFDLSIFPKTKQHLRCRSIVFQELFRLYYVEFIRVLWALEKIKSQNMSHKFSMMSSVRDVITFMISSTPNLQVEPILNKINLFSEKILRSWIVKQKENIHSFIFRALESEKWLPISESKRFSHSVVDLFSLINNILDTVYKLSRKVLPFGIWESSCGDGESKSVIKEVFLLFQSLTNSVLKYCQEIVNQCGHREGRKFNLKNATGNPQRNSNSNRVGRIKDKLNAIKATVRNVSPRGQTINFVVIDIPSLQLEEISIRLMTIMEAKDQLISLGESIEKNLISLLNTGSKEFKDLYVSLFLEPDESLITGEHRKQVDFINQAFAPLLDNMYDLLAERVVKFDLGIFLYERLYYPSAHNFKLSDEIFSELLNDSMVSMSENVGAACMKYIARCMFKNIIATVQSIVSDFKFGRTFIPEDSSTVLLPDLHRLMEMFSSEISAEEKDIMTKHLSMIIRGMGKSTEQIIRLYQRNELSRDLVHQILQTRRNDQVAIRFLREN